MAWGYHLILDVGKCDIQKISDPLYIKSTVEDLVKEIDMVPFGECRIEHFGKGSYDHEGISLAGWTAVQLIETSSIILHMCDATGDGYIDIFSCKNFDPEIVVNFIQRRFSPQKTKNIFLTRDAPK